MKNLYRAALAAAFGLTLSLSATAAGAPKTFTQDDAKAIIGDLQRVVTPRGIDVRQQITLGGIQQWITVRGRDDSNPILLFIHGGPAAPEMPTSWTFQNDWEDFFTVVQWDQRGAGKTYLANDPAKVGPTMTPDRMVEDAAELVQYLRSTYHKDKIFVLGHSWGSYVGLRLAHEHPAGLYAYIGMGQIIDMREQERLDYEWTLAAAEAAHNVEAVKQLKAIEPYPDAQGQVTLDAIGTERNWNLYYGGLSYGRDSYDYYFHAGKLSPDYSDADYKAIDQGSGFTLPALLPELMRADFTKTTEFKCPIIIFNGRHDTTVSAVLAGNWFKTVHAPVKKLVWFENSAHMMQIEQPGLVLMHLVDDVRPLAGGTSVPGSSVEMQ
ncbi:MAG TPA: alpha/beta hydrolase [Gammaproteobacteria bacterium]|nr:alpha/beta hydrolase [Gammaproteobacteria bacterium]